MALAPRVCTAAVPVVLGVTPSTSYRSKSNTAGCTQAPPVEGTAQMSAFRPPVEAYCAIGWSWYCHLASSGGFQHAPAEVAHGTGAGGAAETAATAIEEPATSASTAATTRVRCGRMRHLLPRGRIPWRPAHRQIGRLVPTVPEAASRELQT